MENIDEDRILSDLFRHSLGNAEIIPSISAGTSLMRKVGVREFLRFNPARINIWYAGAAILAGTALTLILSSDPKSEKPEIQQPEQIENSNGQSGNSGVIKESPAIIPGNMKREAVSDEKIDGQRTPAELSEVRKPEKNSSENMVTGEGGTQKVNSLPGPDILQNPVTDNNTLKKKRGTVSYIRASETAGCSPLTIKFRCLAVPFDSCMWDFGDGGRSSERDPEWLFDNSGEYTVTLQVFSSGTLSVSTITINVYPKPSARFEISPENAVIPRDEVTFHNYSDEAEKYRWDFGDGTDSELFEPRHNYRKYGKFSVSLIAISEFGCSDSLVIHNAFSGSGSDIEFPNAFIPNGNGPSGGYYTIKSDEDSQIFHPVCSGVTDYTIRIFSKTGILVFESSDLNFGWDGYYKGQLCDPGVYIWKVRGIFMSGEQFTRMGDLTLLRR